MKFCGKQLSLNVPEDIFCKWLSAEKLGIEIRTHFDITIADPGGRPARNKGFVPGFKLMFKDRSPASPVFFIYPNNKSGRAEVITVWPNKSVPEEYYSLDKLKDYIKSFIPSKGNAGGAA